MSIHFPFARWVFSSDLILTTGMNSALAIKTKDYYAAQRWVATCCSAHIPRTVNSPQMFYIDINNLNLSCAEKGQA